MNTIDESPLSKRVGRRAALSACVLGALALPVAAQESGKCPGPGVNTLEAAGTLLLFATAEHGADGLRMALAALVAQASPGCS